MPQYKAPIRDFQFLLHEYLNLAQYKDIPGFADANPELMTPVLEAAAQMCEEVLFPLNAKGDEVGLKYDNGKVIMPDGWFLVRGSNTEPIIRIVAEARSEARARKMVAEVYQQVTSWVAA